MTIKEEDFRKKLSDLNEIRDALDKSKLKKELKMTKWEDENHSLLEYIRELKSAMQKLENDIKTDALDMYEQSDKSTKKLIGGVGIQTKTRLDFIEEKALDWAKQHGLCLKLDLSNFKKIAKTQDIEFVTKSEYDQATIPSKIKLE